MSMDPRGSLDSTNVSFVCASVLARASVHPLSLSHCWTCAEVSLAVLPLVVGALSPMR